MFCYDSLVAFKIVYHSILHNSHRLDVLFAGWNTWDMQYCTDCCHSAVSLAFGFLHFKQLTDVIWFTLSVSWWQVTVANMFMIAHVTVSMEAVVDLGCFAPWCPVVGLGYVEGPWGAALFHNHRKSRSNLGRSETQKSFNKESALLIPWMVYLWWPGF